MSAGASTLNWAPVLAAAIFAIPCCGSEADDPGHGASGASGASGGAARGGSGSAGSAGSTSGRGGSAGAQVSSAGSAGADNGVGGNAGAQGGAAGSAGTGGAPVDPGCEPETVGNWTFGSGNLNMSVDVGCVVSNFCSIEEGIHTQGTLSEGMLHLDSVGGAPLSFAYTVSNDTFTIVDGFQGTDLPLSRLDGPLPVTCPAP